MAYTKSFPPLISCRPRSSSSLEVADLSSSWTFGPALSLLSSRSSLVVTSSKERELSKTTRFAFTSWMVLDIVMQVALALS